MVFSTWDGCVRSSATYLSSITVPISAISSIALHWSCSPGSPLAVPKNSKPLHPAPLLMHDSGAQTKILPLMSTTLFSKSRSFANTPRSHGSFLVGLSSGLFQSHFRYGIPLGRLTNRSPRSSTEGGSRISSGSAPTASAMPADRSSTHDPSVEQVSPFAQTCSPELQFGEIRRIRPVQTLDEAPLELSTQNVMLCFPGWLVSIPQAWTILDFERYLFFVDFSGQTSTRSEMSPSPFGPSKAVHPGSQGMLGAPSPSKEHFENGVPTVVDTLEGPHKISVAGVSVACSKSPKICEPSALLVRPVDCSWARASAASPQNCTPDGDVTEHRRLLWVASGSHIFSPGGQTTFITRR
mmetsp:Transcript_39755/g.94415  ORF Transcript_39755/g.94415 Transcript_39755/m.94415 type:complete len:353 (-) Transcript_39755:1821-2879(-)